MKFRTLAVPAVALAATVSLSGCWGSHASNNQKVIEKTGPATVIQFPYGFRNVAYKCDGANMVYISSAGVDDTLPSSVAVVPNDPRCTGGR